MPQPQLLNPTALLIKGRPFDWTPQFDSASPITQGLGCQGDDGWYAISGLPAGLTADAAGRITGTPVLYMELPAALYVHIGIMGTSDDCNDQVVYYEYDLQLTAIEPAAWSKNPIFTRVEAFGLGKRAQLELYVEDAWQSDNYQLAVTLELPPDASEGATFRYDSVLDAILEADAEKDIPQPGQLWRVHRYTARRFYVRHRILTLDGPTEWVQLQARQVNLGGVAYHEFPSDVFWANPVSVIEAKQIALNARPAVTEVRKGPLYLTLFGYAGGGRVRYRFSKPDGTTRTLNADLPDNPLSGGQAGAVILCTHSFLLNYWPADDELPEYSVEYIDTSTPDRGYGPVSLRLDRSYSPTERAFLYRNSKGGLETLVCTGTSLGKIEVERQSATRAIQPSYQASLPTSFTAGLSASQKMKVSTGWFPDQYRAAQVAQELMLARQVYELKGNQWLPVSLVTKSLEYFEDGEYLTAFAFEYEYGFDTTATAIL